MALIIVIQNISALAPISDYNYEVLVGDGTPDRSVGLVRGRIDQHVREDGWQALVQRVLNVNPKGGW